MAKDKEGEVKVVQMTTQTEEVLELPDGTQTNLTGYLAWLGNKILAIESSVA